MGTSMTLMRNKMQCEKCQKEATVHITKVVNSQKEEVHLCEDCAEQYDDKIEHIFNHPDIDSDEVTNVHITTEHNVVSQMLEQVEGAIADVLGEMPSRQIKTCSECGMTLERFMKKGKFGCPKDYEIFAEELKPIMERLHGGNTQHAGKIPKRDKVAMEKQITTLEAEMSSAIKAENYERAAQIRDTLNELQRS